MTKHNHSGALDAAITKTARQPILSVTRQYWRNDGEYKTVMQYPDWQELSETVFQRDDYTCCFCHFQSSRYQEVLCIDGNYHNHALTNLLTVCPLCHQVYHLGYCAMHNSAFIAAIPELKQTDINHIVRAIFVTACQKEILIDERLNDLYTLFSFRGKGSLKACYGLDLSNPFILAEFLSFCPDAVYQQREQHFNMLRVIPTGNAFPAEQLDYYIKEHKQLFSAENWLDKTNKLLSYFIK